MRWRPSSWRKRLGARLPPLGSRVRVSVIPCGFRGGTKRGLGRCFTGFLPFSPTTNFIPTFLTTHIIRSIILHPPCDDAPGVVGRHSCFPHTSIRGFVTSYPSTRPCVGHELRYYYYYYYYYYYCYYYCYENNNFKRSCLRICMFDPTIYLWSDTRWTHITLWCIWMLSLVLPDHYFKIIILISIKIFFILHRWIVVKRNLKEVGLLFRMRSTDLGGQVSCVRFFRGFSSLVRQMSESFRPIRFLNIIWPS